MERDLRSCRRIEADDSWDFFTEPDPSNGCVSLPPSTCE